MDFTVFIRKLQMLEKFIVDEASKIVKDIEPLINQYQRKRLQEGKTTKGDLIQSGYSAPYAGKRRKRGLQTRYVDLKFTGEFYKGLELKQLSKENPLTYKVLSNVDYDKYLDRFKDIRGLDKEAAADIKKIIVKVLSNRIKHFLTS